MSQVVADSVKPLRRIAVNDAFRLCPDAEALCASDRAWWLANPDSLDFKGRKFSNNPPSGVELIASDVVRSGSNSALLGLHIAIRVFDATRVLLYGVDMSAEKGAHYFGPHQTLKNTSPERFEVFKRQFAAYKADALPAGVEVVNCTVGSALKCFPFL